MPFFHEKILITGGAGFIGSNLILHVLQEGHQVLNLDKLTYAGNLASLREIEKNPSYQFSLGDICDIGLVSKLLEDFKPDAVINLAAESHVDRSIDDPEAFIQTNIIGTYRILEACHIYWKTLDCERKERFRFLHVSTDEVYGSLGPSGTFTEKTPYSPNSPYSASKASSDHLVRSYYQTFSLPTLVTNCSNNYGPRQFPEKLIPLCIIRALRGETLPVYGDGLNVRDWIYVEDHCRGITAVLEKGICGECYNIGASEEKTNIAIVESICQLLDEFSPLAGEKSYREQIIFVPDRPGHDRRYAIDANKIRNALGWSPQTTFDDGLRKTVKWYMENTVWTDAILNGTYNTGRLGTLREGTQ